MKKDKYIFTIYSKEDVNNVPQYNGQLDTVKKQLQKNINTLISDFETQFKSLVLFDDIDISDRKERVKISLLIDLRKIDNSSHHQ